ncbi:MAG: hypothetical protein JWQ24_1506 [Tardiphaga sp.]|nr:hypothetical protein [Tardiphaga sp.]
MIACRGSVKGRFCSSIGWIARNAQIKTSIGASP